ncbi:MAG TPA: hypothetical protein VJV74_04805 [Terriglobia bacterium]|nr:hypothetical protein [Terriglobia bacterium]
MTTVPRPWTVRTRIILIQLGIVAGLLAWYKVYVPRMERERAAAEAEARAQRIAAFVPAMVVEDTSREVEAPGMGGEKRHPEKLRRTPTVEEVEQALGAPDERTTDFRGGLHLTWMSERLKLEASFNQDRLYCLRTEDRRTGHGALVFESSWSWQPF